MNPVNYDYDELDFDAAFRKRSKVRPRPRREKAGPKRRTTSPRHATRWTYEDWDDESSNSARNYVEFEDYYDRPLNRWR